MSNERYFAVFNMGFDEDGEQLDYGRFSVNHLDDDGTGGTDLIVVATMATSRKQGRDDFNERGGLMPPQYRVPAFGTKSTWSIDTRRQNNSNLGGLCYQVLPVYVTTENQISRGEFFLHRNLNGVGSLGCTVFNSERLQQVANVLDGLSEAGIKRIPYFVYYS